MQVVADIGFSVHEVPAAGTGSSPGPVMTGSLKGNGQDLFVHFSQTPSLLGSSTRPLVRPLADALDRAGLTVHLSGPAGPLLHLGRDVRAPWWQVPLTRTRRLRLVSLSRVVLAARSGPRLFEAELPPQIVLPTIALLDTRAERRALLLRQVARRLTGHRR